jgi:hypothetical protein
MSTISYKDSGVDIDAGNSFIEDIKPYVKATINSNVIGGIGSFAGAYELPTGYKKPVILGATDGVGTKLKLAIDSKRFDSVGIDLVAMCVNDLICNFAEPMFFLDYYATSKLDTKEAAQVVKGIAKGCELSDTALIGGETIKGLILSAHLSSAFTLDEKVFPIKLWGNHSLIVANFAELPDSKSPLMLKYKEAFNKYAAKGERWGVFFYAGIGFAEPLVEGLKRCGRNLTRERLVKAMEGIQNFQGIMGRVNYKPFDPNSPLCRLGQKEVFLAQATKDAKYKVLTDWIQTDYINYK